MDSADLVQTKGLALSLGDTRFGVAWPNSCEWLEAGKTTLARPV